MLKRGVLQRNVVVHKMDELVDGCNQGRTILQGCSLRSRFKLSLNVQPLQFDPSVVFSQAFDNTVHCSVAAGKQWREDEPFLVVVVLTRGPSEEVDHLANLIVRCLLGRRGRKRYCEQLETLQMKNDFPMGFI